MKCQRRAAQKEATTNSVNQCDEENDSHSKTGQAISDIYFTMMKLFMKVDEMQPYDENHKIHMLYGNTFKLPHAAIQYFMCCVATLYAMTKPYYQYILSTIKHQMANPIQVPRQFFS